MTIWQQWHRVEWDATRGQEWRRPKRTSVGAFAVEMARFDYSAGVKDPGAITPVLDLAKALERVGFPVVWAWATHFNFSRKIACEQCGYFEHQRCVQFEGCVAEPLPTTAILGSKWSRLLLRRVLQDALSEVMKVCPPVFFVEDTKAFMEERCKKLTGIAETPDIDQKRFRREGLEVVEQRRRDSW